MKFSTFLSTMLMIPIIASARGVRRASNSSDTMQLICTTGGLGIYCSSLYGTSCSPAGVLQNRNITWLPTNGDCTSKHCSCQMAPPQPCFTETGTKGNGTVCGPMAIGVSTYFDGIPTARTGNAPFTNSAGHVSSGSAYATVTMTVTITQHHRGDNGSCSFSHTGSFSRHHESASSKSVMTQTQSANPFFPLTFVPRTTISSTPLISLTGNPQAPPSASSVNSQSSLLTPNFGSAGTPGGASASSSSAPYNRV